MSQKNTNTQKIVGLGLFTAIVVVLQLMGSFIKFGTFSISLVLVPVVIGAALYGAGALTMIFALRCGELSVLHPMLGAGYVLSLLLGSVLLNEPLSSTKLIGVAVIVAGLVLLARSGEGGR